MIATILSSAAVAAIIASMVAWLTAQKRISIENVTQERRNWRESVRDRALDVHDAMVAADKQKLDRLRCEFRARLNPLDPNDRQIIECITPPNEGKELEKAEEFAIRISLLLKHDWERAKVETSPALVRIWRRIRHEPRRRTYDEVRQ